MNLIANLISVSKTAKHKIKALSNCSFYFLENNYHESAFRCHNVNFISFEICWYVVVHKYRLLTDVFHNFDELLHNSCFQGYNISDILLIKKDLLM